MSRLEAALWRAETLNDEPAAPPTVSGGQGSRECATGGKRSPDRTSAGQRPPDSAKAKRVEQALSVLREMGGFCQSEGTDGKIIIRCFQCPLAVAVLGHAEVCNLVETVLGDVLGLPTQQRCQTEPVHQCYFEVGTAEE